MRPWPALALLLALAPMPGRAHCDTLDGPVVKDARAALETGDLTPVMKWVRASDEAELRAAFQRARSVRALGAEARGLADQFFFETVVRVHRAGEGAPFTGLKAAGTDLGPAVPAGDRALETGDLKPLWGLLSSEAHATLHARFEAARRALAEAPRSVEAGRRYVAAYVAYIHYVEGLHASATAGGNAHGDGGHAAHMH